MTYTNNLNSILHLSQQEAQRLGNSQVEPEHLLLGILRLGAGRAYELLAQSGVDSSLLKKAIDERMNAEQGQTASEHIPFSRTTERILRLTAIEAGYYHEKNAGSEHLLLSVLRERLNFPALWLDQQYNVTYESVEKLHPKPQKQAQSNLGSIIAGDLGDVIKTIIIRPEKQKQQKNTEESEEESSILRRFGTDLTQMAAEQKLDIVLGRRDEIQRTIQILSRRKKNNPVLVGEAGVGKTAIVEGLAQSIVCGTYPILKDKRIVTINMANMVAGTSYRGQFEERMQSLVAELKAHPEIILFIDEIHTIIGAGNASGGLDASNILKPALARGEIRCIGATTSEEYRKSIEKDGALERRFQKVDVAPMDKKTTYDILRYVCTSYMEHHHVTYSEESLKACVELSDRYITDRAFPDKAIDVIDEAGAQKAQLWYEKGKVQAVTPEDIALVVSRISGIPVSKMTMREKQQLLNLDSELKSSIIGQDDAVNKVVHAIRRSRLNLNDPNRPIGTFFFLGPTGVGKTWLARCLAKQMFGTEDALIRFDMSEYMEQHTVSLMVGAPPGYVAYEEGGKLTKAVHQRPYSIVLFDEIEKAHHDIFNILLQVLDEGHLTDRQGRKVDFRNTIIILTSNVGTRQLRDFGGGVGFESSNMTRQQTEQTLTKAMNRTFPPEFVNRLDEIIFFHALDKESVAKILDIEINKLRDKLRKTGYSLSLSEQAKNELLEKAYDPPNGARPVKRAVRKWIEDPLTERILQHPEQKKNKNKQH